MITVQVNGEDFENFDRIAVFKSMEMVSGAFALSSSASKDNLFPLKKGDAVRIMVDGNSVLSGYIEKISVNYSSKLHTITASGRDKLADMIDSSVQGAKEFTGSVSLVDITRSVLDGLGLSTVKVIDKTDGIEPFSETEITSAEVVKNSFEFIELHARKRQVLLTSDGDSNLVLQRASTDVLPGTIQNIKPDNNQNNVIEAEFETDDSSRFNKYITQGELNPFLLDFGTTPEQISNQNGTVFDGQIRASRVLEFNAEESSDSFTSTGRATWESNIRRARSISYRPKMQGHELAGQQWETNKLIRVNDEFANPPKTMLIRAVTFQQSLDEGSTTTLDLTYRDAYTLQAEQDQREATTDEANLWDF